MGWRLGNCLVHVFESTANVVLLIRTSCSASFHQVNAVAKKRRKSRSSVTQQPTSKWDVVVIVMCLVIWFMCHVVQLRLLSIMASVDVTWQAYLLPCFQRLYRAAWSLWLLRLNKQLKDMVDSFCRSCAKCPENVGEASERWACVTAFAGQITQEGDSLQLRLAVLHVFISARTNESQ